MPRRPNPPLFNANYCGNKSTKQVHDLINEKPQCRIDEIIGAGHALPFQTLSSAHAQGYIQCAYCLGRSTR
jgi:hypothetical protein